MYNNGNYDILGGKENSIYYEIFLPPIIVSAQIFFFYYYEKICNSTITSLNIYIFIGGGGWYGIL
jgi:hypothetical protein